MSLQSSSRCKSGLAPPVSQPQYKLPVLVGNMTSCTSSPSSNSLDLQSLGYLFTVSILHTLSPEENLPVYSPTTVSVKSVPHIPHLTTFPCGVLSK